MLATFATVDLKAAQEPEESPSVYYGNTLCDDSMAPDLAFLLAGLGTEAYSQCTIATHRMLLVTRLCLRERQFGLDVLMLATRSVRWC
jgi:hypothetical protein